MVTAQRSAAAIAFRDKRNARANLAALHIKNSVTVACLYDADDVLFTYVTRSPVELAEGVFKHPDNDDLLVCPKEKRKQGVYAGEKIVELYNDIHSMGRYIGYIYVQSGYGEIAERQNTLIKVSGAIMVLSLILSLIVTKPLQWQITKPIIDLGNIAKTVNCEKDYSIRAKVHNEDELGVTTRAFNSMLATIEKNSEDLTNMAYCDTLTGLANRRRFRDDLEDSLDMAKREQNKSALIFIDLDKFKPINDTLGHDVGDMLLETVADRLRESMPSDGMPYRLGGDEFTVVLSHLQGDDEAEVVAKKILENFSRETVLLGNKINITASLGIAMSDGEESIDELMKRADLILYEVKESGRNGYKFAS